MSDQVRYRLSVAQGGNIVLKDFRDGMVPARFCAVFAPNPDRPQAHRDLAETVCRLLNDDWRKRKAAHAPQEVRP